MGRLVQQPPPWRATIAHTSGLGLQTRWEATPPSAPRGSTESARSARLPDQDALRSARLDALRSARQDTLRRARQKIAESCEKRASLTFSSDEGKALLDEHNTLIASYASALRAHAGTSEKLEAVREALTRRDLESATAAAGIGGRIQRRRSMLLQFDDITHRETDWEGLPRAIIQPGPLQSKHSKSMQEKAIERLRMREPSLRRKKEKEIRARAMRESSQLINAAPLEKEEAIERLAQWWGFQPRYVYDELQRARKELRAELKSRPSEDLEELLKRTMPPPNNFIHRNKT